MAIVFLGGLPAWSQTVNQRQYLDTGDHVPDLVVQNVSNWTKSSFRLSDFRGKLLILDFWDRTCVSCIKSFPKADSLQKKFGNKLQWILVTRNSQQQVDDWFNRLKKNPIPKLVSVTSDTVFSNLFFYRSVPHLVIIDTNGKVAAITSPASATAQNLTALLNGKTPALYYNNQIPLSEIKDPWNEVESPYMEYFSCLMRRIKGRPSGGDSWLTDSVTRKRMGYRTTTSTILDLYKMAWGNAQGGGPFSYNNQVILEVANPSDYLFPVDPAQGNEWIDDHCYQYAIRVPPARAGDLYALMREDLNRYFNIEAKIERRKRECLLLVRTSTKDKIKTAGEKPVYQQHDTGYTLKNHPVSWLIYAIAGSQFVRPFNFPYPIVDNTNYTANIDIDLHVNMKNIPALRKELNKYDLDLVKGEKELDVLVIREKNFVQNK
jgi:thiol-disulfide isomerase/thioredoxin